MCEFCPARTSARNDVCIKTPVNTVRSRGGGVQNSTWNLTRSHHHSTEFVVVVGGGPYRILSLPHANATTASAAPSAATAATTTTTTKQTNAPSFQRQVSPTMSSLAALRSTATRRLFVVPTTASSTVRNTQRRHFALGEHSGPAPEWTGVDKIVRSYFPHDYQRTFNFVIDFSLLCVFFVCGVLFLL